MIAMDANGMGQAFGFVSEPECSLHVTMLDWRVEQAKAGYK